MSVNHNQSKERKFKTVSAFGSWKIDLMNINNLGWMYIRSIAQIFCKILNKTCPVPSCHKSLQWFYNAFYPQHGQGLIKYHGCRVTIHNRTNYTPSLMYWTDLLNTNHHCPLVEFCLIYFIWDCVIETMLYNKLFFSCNHIDGLVQGRSNSIALSLELRLSCINPLTYPLSKCNVGLTKAVLEFRVWINSYIQRPCWCNYLSIPWV